MALDAMSIDPKKYVVVDVETNGLRCREHDLLSISLFKPDDGKTYERFLPLDLNSSISAEISEINGITEEDLAGLAHMSQEEVDTLFTEFGLSDRILLHYGSLDERFIREYFKRQSLVGYESLTFFNFKSRICSSSFSTGNLTKDNLCKAFGIEGVKKVHDGLSDCKLEWQLFEKMQGRYLLVLSGSHPTSEGGAKFDFIYYLNSDYLIPVSYLANYPNLAKAVGRPHIFVKSEVVFRHSVLGDENIKKFGGNISGIALEHLINSLLDVQMCDSRDQLIRNRSKLSEAGKITTDDVVVPVVLNPDGSLSSIYAPHGELILR